MTPLCPSKIDCPGGPDNPVSNFSSEGVDPLIFVGTGWPNDPTPGPGHRYFGHDCYGNQISAVSQEDADFITYTLSRLCKNQPGQGTDSYQTHDQTACGSCPDGEEFCYTVPAYTFVAPIQSDSGVAMVAAADAHALAYAQQQVSILISRGRCDNTTCKILTNPPLPQGTVGNPYSTNLVGKSDNPLRTWSIVSGSLPPGLSLTSLGLFGNSLGLISGTPTQQGTYPFKVRMNCGTRLLSTTRNFSIKVNPGSSAHLAAYWTLDEASGDRVDSVSGVHLIPYVNPPTSVDTPTVSGMFGLAVHGPIIAPPITNYVCLAGPPSSASPALTYSGKGFTILEWIRVSSYDNTDPNNGLNQLMK